MLRVKERVEQKRERGQWEKMWEENRLGGGYSVNAN